MATAQGKSHKHPVNPEQKYIRLQIVGMSFGLSILPAMMLACMLNLGALVGQIAALLFVVGCVFFFFGMIGRQELRERRERETDSEVKKV